MQLYILFVFTLLADASDLLGERLPTENFPSETSELLEAFEKFLLRSLDEDGSYHRDLLILGNVVPPPPNYEIPIEYDPSLVQLSPKSESSDVLEYFKNYVESILNSEVYFINALNRFVGEKGIEFLLKSETSQRKETKPTAESTQTLHYDTYANSITHDSKDEFLTTGSNLDESKSVSLETFNQEKTQTYSNDYHQENSESKKFFQYNKEKNDGLTSEYINFLTEGLSSEADTIESQNENDFHLMSEASTSYKIGQDQMNPKVSPEKYIEPLQTDSTYSSSASSSDEIEIELSPTEQSNDISSEGFISTKFVEFDTNGYNHAIVTELPSTKGKRNDHVGLINSHMPLEDLESWLEENSDEDSYVEFHDLDSKVEDVSKESPIELYEVYPEPKQLEEKLSSDRQGKQLNEFLESKPKEGEISPKLYYIPGTPGVQFPNYDDIPDTRFACGEKNHIPGFYADQETNCQVFHVCWPGRRESFLCPLGTIFNQVILACDYWYSSNCSIAHAYFDVNSAFKKESSQTGSTAPMVDTLIKASHKETPAEVITDIRQIDELYEADVHFSETIAKEELSQIWKFLPIKAKVFIEQPPEFQEYLAKLHKQKRSEDTTDTDVTEPDHTDSDFENERVLTLKETIETGLLRVLKNLVSSTKVEIA